MKGFILGCLVTFALMSLGAARIGHYVDGALQTAKAEIAERAK